MKIFLCLVALCGIIFSVPAKADDGLMVLWPNQRAKHQDKIDDNAAKYRARGQDYTNHLYATAGEEPMPEPDGFMMGEDEIDTVPVNVRQVADIVKAETPQ